MQTCSKCGTQSPDSAKLCGKCQADLSEFSATSVALKRLQSNPRVRAIRISVGEDACPACEQMQGVYPKDQVPRLPVEGCSQSAGCRCTYEPLLDEIYP